jgi:hypothetical protein
MWIQVEKSVVGTDTKCLFSFFFILKRVQPKIVRPRILFALPRMSDLYINYAQITTSSPDRVGEQ